MHWIQREILKRLSTATECRYIELKPENVDGNLFMYHLKQLIQEGYIKKTEKAYTLTKEGKRYVGALSLSTGKTTQIPKVMVMVYCENKKGEQLLYKWNRQPYLGHTSLPFSRVRYGQSISDAVSENIKNKTNLEGKTEYAGDIYVIVKNDDGSTVTHYLAHIFILDKIKGELYADGLTGKPFWGNIGDIEGPGTVHGTKEIIRIIKTKKAPFFEEIIVLKK